MAFDALFVSWLLIYQFVDKYTSFRYNMRILPLPDRCNGLEGFREGYYVKKLTAVARIYSLIMNTEGVYEKIKQKTKC